MKTLKESILSSTNAGGSELFKETDDVVKAIDELYKWVKVVNFENCGSGRTIIKTLGIIAMHAYSKNRSIDDVFSAISWKEPLNTKEKKVLTRKQLESCKFIEVIFNYFVKYMVNYEYMDNRSNLELAFDNSHGLIGRVLSIMQTSCFLITHVSSTKKLSEIKFEV